jgi:hypothetical protein
MSRRSLRHTLVGFVLLAAIVGALALAVWAWLRVQGALAAVIGHDAARSAFAAVGVGLLALWAIRLVPDLLRMAGSEPGAVRRVLDELCPARPLSMALFAVRAAVFALLVGLAVHDLVRALAG